MQNEKQIIERLDLKLTDQDKSDIKTALFAYLAKNDQDVLQTDKDTMKVSELLPFLKNVSQLWREITADDFCTSKVAINSAYHTVRNQFKNLVTLKFRVQEYLHKEDSDEESSVQEKQQAQIQTRSSIQIIPAQTAPVRGRPRLNILGDTKRQKTSDQASRNSEQKAEQPEQKKMIDLQIVPFTEAVQINFKGEHDKLTEQLKAKKREVKFLEKDMQNLQSKIIGWGNPYDESQ